jgi:BolA protein
VRADRIRELIHQNFPKPLLFELEDESHLHAGRTGQESHFKLMLVHESFDGQSRVQRQRQINSLLKSEFDQGLHALSMRLLTAVEYEKQHKPFATPDCQGSQQT